MLRTFLKIFGLIVNMNLVDPLIKDELIHVAKCMVIDKVPRLNDVKIKFIFTFGT